jgi:small subunit ribosomal protein S1
MTSSTEASTSNPVDTDQQNVANTADGSTGFEVEASVEEVM